jgi:hypothetical protein
MRLKCTSYEALTVTNAVKKLTTAKLTPTTGRFANQMAAMVLISVETDAIRYTFDTATTVSATVGAYMASGDSMEFTMDLANFSMFRVTTDAKVHVHYFHAV